MLIDDSPVMRRFLSGFLGKKWTIVEVSNGLEALAHLRAGGFPDLILADLNMPQLNGFQFLERMQASPLYQQIPVMILSGSTDSADRIRCLELGAIDYLQKPFNPTELELRIQATLMRRPTA